MPVKRIPAPTADALIRPVWVRAVITTIFAVVTVFWQDETLTLLKEAVAAVAGAHGMRSRELYQAVLAARG